MKTTSPDFFLLKEHEIEIPARCKHFNICGGCKIQHFPYSVQLEQKSALIKHCFSPLFDENAQLFPIIAAPASWHYRNKMEFTFSQNLEGKQSLGLYRDKKPKGVFDVEECYLTSPWFQEALDAVRLWWKQSSILAYYPPKDNGSLRTLTLRESFHTKQKMAILTVSGNQEFVLSTEDLEGFVQALQQVNASTHIILRSQILEKGKPTLFEECVLSGSALLKETLTLSLSNEKHILDFCILPSAFFQPNTAQAEILYSTALELAGISKDDTVFDLYSGTGTLSLFAALLAKKVISIELNEDAVNSARQNQELNHLNNIEMHVGDVGKTLSLMREKADIVMVDPPRSGLDARALENILALDAKVILYISCNPKTQAENVNVLIEQGYRIKIVQPVDQFPHTLHIENIVVLVKNAS